MKDEKLREEGEKTLPRLAAGGSGVLLDDRNERAGVKFKDADLIASRIGSRLGVRIAMASWNFSIAARSRAKT